jgi:hypothetical protein
VRGLGGALPPAPATSAVRRHAVAGRAAAEGELGSRERELGRRRLHLRDWKGRGSDGIGEEATRDARVWAERAFTRPMDKKWVCGRASAPWTERRPRSRHVSSIGRPKIQSAVRAP